MICSEWPLARAQFLPRIAEAVEFDMKIDNNEVVAYRAKMKVPFSYET